MPSDFHGLAGVYAGQSLTPRNIFTRWEHAQLRMLPTIATIDGTLSRDVGETPTSLIRAGNLMGKVATSGKYRPSIIGVTTASSLAGATALAVNAAVATELARLIAVAAGNVNLTIQGPPAASGVVTKATVACSAASGTSLTVAATPVSEVQTVAVDTIMSGGKIDLTAVKSDGTLQDVNVAYDTSWTQTVADIQTALIAALGTAAVACAVTNTHDMTVTFSGAGYTGVQQPLLLVDISAATGPTKVTVTRTTPGSAGLPAMAAGSLIRPADGSQTALTVNYSEFGVDVTDRSGVSMDQPLSKQGFCTGGDLKTAFLVNFLTDDFTNAVDPSLIAALKAELKAAGTFTFDNDR